MHRPRTSRTKSVHRFLFVAAVAVALALSAVRASVHALEPDKALLLRSAQDRERLLRTFSVKVDVTTTRNPSSAHAIRLESRQEVHIDNNRVRCTATRQETNSEGELTQLVSVGVSDGQRIQVVSGADNRWLNGWVARSFASTPFPWDVPVSAYLTHFEQKPLSLWLSRDDVRVFRETRSTAAEILIAEWGPFDVRGRQNLARLEFSFQHGLAMRRAASLVRFGRDDAWKEYYVLEVLKYTADSESGAALPARSRRALTQIRDANSAPVPVFVTDVRFTDWNLSPQISSDLFTFRFPKGVLVEDSLSGQNYISTTIADDDLAQMITVARDMGPARTGRIAYLLICFAIVAASVTVLLWPRFFSRNR